MEETTNRTLLEDLVEVSTSFAVTDLPLLAELENSTFSEGFNETTTTRRNHNSVLNFFDEHSWVLWTIVAVVCVALVSLVIGIIVWIWKNKSESNEAIVHSGYEGGSRSCFCCCREEPPERTNSASNLDPYRRRPLPPIAGSEYGPNGAPEVLVSTRRLDPLKGMTNPQDPSLGIYITSIQGVPTIHVRKEDYRPLPQITTQ